MDRAPLTRPRGHALLGNLLGLALGLLLLQALLEALATVQQACRQQALLARQRDALAVAQVRLRALAWASRQRAASAGEPAALRVVSGVDGPAVQAWSIADAAAGACGEAPQPAGSRHRYRLEVDRSGSLRCGVDQLAAQPLADGLAAWRLQAVEASGDVAAPRWRLLPAAEVVDWRRVAVLRRGAASAAPAADDAQWLALPALGRADR